MHARRNAAAIVRHRHAAVDFQRDLDRLSIPGHVFIDAVIHDLIHEMVQAINAGTADVHGRSFPNGFKALKHADLVRTVPTRLDVWGKGTRGPHVCGRRCLV